jgi:hypothetical protein
VVVCLLVTIDRWLLSGYNGSAHAKCAWLFLEDLMNVSLLANRRVWFLIGFSLLLVLAVFYALTETSLGATTTVQMYLPLIAKIPVTLCGTIPC